MYPLKERIHFVLYMQLIFYGIPHEILATETNGRLFTFWFNNQGMEGVDLANRVHSYCRHDYKVYNSTNSLDRAVTPLIEFLVPGVYVVEKVFEYFYCFVAMNNEIVAKMYNVYAHYPSSCNFRALALVKGVR